MLIPPNHTDSRVPGRSKVQLSVLVVLMFIPVQQLQPRYKGRTALLGYTGFVGSNLSLRHEFSVQVNRKTIQECRGQKFDLVVCAAAPGSMFEANTFPEQDEEKIDALVDELSHIQTEQFVLISSIAVLADFAGGDDETTTSFQQENAYGRHRRKIEVFVEQNFSDSLVIRLPALFGPGLRKNFIFDVINPVPSYLPDHKFDILISSVGSDLRPWILTLYTRDKTNGLLRLDRAALNRDSRRLALENIIYSRGLSAVHFHNPKTTHQFYDIGRLWSDIITALDAGISLLHLVSEPLPTYRIYKQLLGREMPDSQAQEHHEDMRTCHGHLWNVPGPYLVDAATTLESLESFYSHE